jgi:hypothetical protein
VALSIHNNETNACTMTAYVKQYMCKEQCQPWSDAIEEIQSSEKVQAHVLFICFELVKQTMCWF